MPVEYVKDGQIVLNLSANAIGNLQLTNDFIQFNARFRGVPQDIYVPLGAALAIYARENGDGVMFESEAAYEHPEQAEEQPTGFENAGDKTDRKNKSDKLKTTEKKSTSHLRIVK